MRSWHDLVRVGHSQTVLYVDGVTDLEYIKRQTSKSYGDDALFDQEVGNLIKQCLTVDPAARSSWHRFEVL